VWRSENEEKNEDPREMSPFSRNQANAMPEDGYASTGGVYLRRFHDDEHQVIAREGQDADRLSESFIGLAGPVIDYLDGSSADADRRRKLAVTDQLLTDIEELRLEAGHDLSAFLRDRITAAEADIMGTPHRARINNLRRAHEFVLSLQGPLMAANPNNQSNPRLDVTVARGRARRWSHRWALEGAGSSSGFRAGRPSRSVRQDRQRPIWLQATT
jgi:hypothetical protein